ncbi:MAG: DUF255 domain-containing protein [Bacteroidetes bacterium]|nr:DUF255 domain-containing protein [Bacteroidota bacterium]
MRHLWILALIASTNLHAQSGIRWTSLQNWKAVLEEAKRTNKYIFVDAYATWCGPCKLMDKNVYTQVNVGRFFNSSFISVKAQMDSTSKDSPFTQGWYADAAALQSVYAVNAFPSFLFFSPEGKLVYRDKGYLDTDHFMRIASLAKNKDNAYPSLADAFRKHQLDPDQQLLLYNQAMEMKDMLLADSVRKAYKNHFDSLDDKALLTEGNMSFLQAIGTQITLRDRIFWIAYDAPEKFNRFGDPTYAARFVEMVAINQIIKPLLWKDYAGRVAFDAIPQWEGIRALLKTQLPKLKTDVLIGNYQIKYYNYTRNWTEFAKAVDRDLATNPPDTAKHLDVYMRLNDRAWTVFQNCNDSSVLRTALGWSEWSNRLQPNSQQLDTQGNLLYKLGRVQEAIISQEQAVQREKDELGSRGIEYKEGELAHNLQKMKKGEPTWKASK